MSIGAQDAGSAIGFIGLGVMGEPMCRNLARKTGRRGRIRLVADGARQARGVRRAARD